MKNKLKIGIIGLGRFGKLAASILSQHFEVLVYTKDREQSVGIADKIGVQLVTINKAALCDIVILAVPISQTEKMIAKIAPLMKSGSLLMDVCSVKVLPCSWLNKYAPKNIQIMGTHPMFGAVTSSYDLEKQTWNLNNLQIVLCPLRIKKDLLNKIQTFLQKLGLDVIVTTPEDHDKQNAVTLSLVHFLGRSLKQAGVEKQRIYTPGFLDLLKIYKHTTHDDWQLFFDMNNYNPFANEVREKFLRSCFVVNDKIKENYEQNFKKSK